MPLYEYQCRECGEQFEAIVPFSKADDVPCEKCEAPKSERLASTFCCQSSPDSGSPAMPAGGACGMGG